MKAAIEAAGGRDLVREADDARQDRAEQLALLVEENADADAKLPLAPPPVKRGPGRPPGARNKRTEDLARYYLGRYGDPLEGLLALATGDLGHTLRQLRALSDELGVPIQVEKVDGKLVACEPSLMGLLEFKRHALEAALPYLHAKRAPENDKGEVVVPILAIGPLVPGVQPGLQPAGVTSVLDLVDVSPGVWGEGEQDQALSGEPVARSHDGGSHDAS